MMTCQATWTITGLFYFFLFFLSVFVIITVSAAGSSSDVIFQSEMLNARKSESNSGSEYSPVCRGALPFLRWWLDEEQYQRIQTNQHLCTLARHGGDELTNFGGTCDQKTGELWFELGNGNVQFPAYSDSELAEHCRSMCECVKSEDEDHIEDGEAAWPGSETQDLLEPGLGNPLVRPGHLMQQGSGLNQFIRHYCIHNPRSTRCRHASRAGNTLPTCGGETHCNADFKCPAGNRRGCKCLASQFSVQTSLFAAVGCGAMKLKEHGIGGRDLESLDGLACPCNASYVSASCCENSDGIVWEEPHLKLGQLALGPEGL